MQKKTSSFFKPLSTILVFAGMLTTLVSCNQDDLKSLKINEVNDLNFLLMTNIQTLFAKVGINSQKISEGLIQKFEGKQESCEQMSYPTLDDLVRHQSMSKRPEMLKFFCKNRLANALGYCFQLKRFGTLSSHDLKAQLKMDPLFAHQVHQMRLIFDFINKSKSVFDLPHAYFSIVQEWRFQEAEQIRAEGKIIKNLYIGDSLMHLFGDYLSKTNQIKKLSNSAFLPLIGERTDSLLARLGHHLAVLKPKNVILSISGNDIIQHCDSDKLHKHQQEIVDLLKSHGVERIIWLSVPPAIFPDVMFKIPTENLKIKLLSGVEFLDYYSEINNLGAPIPEYTFDGIHVTDIVYKTNWIPKLEKLGVFN